ncbi:hypothetical protein BTW15_01435 [Pseudomonas syringae pv. tomato]|uniref:Uncharacterized protein n=1 Tax=Pseudomonas syringae pv. tomato TaxID=323 RepID=A0AB36L3K1_PSEUB|nr:hypothetical protein [Pseudomonas syringae group genomosp. 3]MBX6510506.1 hypothetical protein [Pseudomonas syringae pv. tomato]OPE62037.1 hypothetical protein BTW15_01435 [Pseudomonas syringae pv. tomato]
MKQSEFRAELTKIMPGYSWTLKKGKATDVVMIATGIQSSGSNRLSTLRVERKDVNGSVSYTAKSAGYGTRAAWLHVSSDGSLARALRGLQDYYENQARKYQSHATDLRVGRSGTDRPAA